MVSGLSSRSDNQRMANLATMRIDDGTLAAAAPQIIGPSIAPTDEQVLVRRAKEGDLPAYDELIQRYQERIMRPSTT